MRIMFYLFLIVMLMLLVSCDNSPDTDFLERLTGMGEITIYRESCNTGGTDTTKWRSKSVFDCYGENDRTEIEKRSFRVDFSNQVVVGGSKNILLTEYPLYGCVVFNSKNWKCSYKINTEKEFVMRMTDGQLTDSFEFDLALDRSNYNSTNTIQIPYFRYWILSVRNFFGG